MRNFNTISLRILSVSLFILALLSPDVCFASPAVDKLIDSVLANSRDLDQSGSCNITHLVLLQLPAHYQIFRTRILEEDLSALEQLNEKWIRGEIADADEVHQAISAEKLNVYFDLPKWRIEAKPVQKFGQAWKDLDQQGKTNPQANIFYPENRQAVYNGEFLIAIKKNQVLYAPANERHKYFRFSDVDPSQHPWSQMKNKELLHPEQSYSVSVQDPFVILTLLDSASDSKQAVRTEHAFDPRLGHSLARVTLFQGEEIKIEDLYRYGTAKDKAISRPIIACRTKFDKNDKMFQTHFYSMEWSAAVDDSALKPIFPAGQYSVLDRRPGGKRAPMQENLQATNEDNDSGFNGWQILASALFVVILAFVYYLQYVR